MMGENQDERRTMTARIELLSLEDSRKTAEQAGLPAGFAELNVFRTLLRRPRTCCVLSGIICMTGKQGSGSGITPHHLPFIIPLTTGA